MKDGSQVLKAILVAAAATAAGAGVYWHQRAAPAGFQSNRDAGSFSELTERVEQLSREVDRLRSQQQLATLAGMPRVSEEPVAGDRLRSKESGKVDDEGTGEERAVERGEDLPSREENEAQRAARLSFLNREFEAQPRDAHWAPETERKLVAALTGPDVSGVKVTGTVCASTLCKLEVAIEKDQNTSEVIHTLARQTTFMSGAELSKTEDARGGATLVVYMSGNGQSLPMAAN
jgi:hypothetical protein